MMKVMYSRCQYFKMYFCISHWKPWILLWNYTFGTAKSPVNDGMFTISTGSAANEAPPCPLMVGVGGATKKNRPMPRLVMSRPCRKACILIKKRVAPCAWWAGGFSRNFVCFKPISPKKQIYFRVVREHSNKNLGKNCMEEQTFKPMISCDRVQQDTTSGFQASPWYHKENHTMVGFCQTISPDFTLRVGWKST